MRWQIVVLGVIVLASAFAGRLAPYDPMSAEPSIQLQPPTFQHLLGTDILGRDVLSRLLYGGQRSLFVATFGTCLAAVVGAGLGVAAGLSTGWLSRILSMLINALLAFPNLLTAMVILTIWGAGVLPLMVATGCAQIAPFASIIRATVIGVLSEAFIESGYSIGATHSHIVRFYILPNIQTTLLTYTAVTFSYCLLNGAALSFLGLGGEPGVPDWGVMLAEGRLAFQEAPWIAVPPGLAITIMILSINSWIDGRMRYRGNKTD